MSSNIIYNSIRFLVLLLVQLFILNQINFGGWIDPYVYVLFILLYPINSNKFGLITASFLIGLIVDIFLNSGGVHACASLLLAYFRPTFLKFAFGLSYEFQTIKIAEKLSVERFTFLLSTIFFHHFILFFLEYLRFDLFFDIVMSTLLSTLLTFVTCVLGIYLIKSNNR